MSHLHNPTDERSPDLMPPALDRYDRPSPYHPDTVSILHRSIQGVHARLDSLLRDIALNKTRHQDRTFHSPDVNADDARPFPPSAQTEPIPPQPPASSTAQSKHLPDPYTISLAKRLLPAPFCGDRSSNPIVFLRELAVYVRVRTLHGADLKTLLWTLFKGQALSWFATIADNFDTYADFIILFIEEYTSPEQVRTQKAQLNRARQHQQEPVEAYLDRMLALYDNLIQETPMEDKLQTILSGLTPAAALHLTNRQYTSIGQLRAQARRLDIILPPSGSGANHARPTPFNNNNYRRNGWKNQIPDRGQQPHFSRGPQCHSCRRFGHVRRDCHFRSSRGQQL